MKCASLVVIRSALDSVPLTLTFIEMSQCRLHSKSSPWLLWYKSTIIACLIKAHCCDSVFSTLYQIRFHSQTQAIHCPSRGRPFCCLLIGLHLSACMRMESRPLPACVYSQMCSRLCRHEHLTAYHLIANHFRAYAWSFLICSVHCLG